MRGQILVTSPAENCSQPDAVTIDRVKVPGKISTCASKAALHEPGQTAMRWVPLILAPRWSQSNRDTPPELRPGTEWMADVLRFLANPAAPPRQRPA